MIDPILYWNDVALEANRISHTDGQGEQTGPTLSSRALAIVHLAMYDAFAGVEGNPPELPAYLQGLPSPPAASSSAAAVAGAALRTLSTLFPSQTARIQTAFTAAGLSGPGVNDGRQFGEVCADAILADRANDPDASDAGYVPSDDRGRHRKDPHNPDQPFHAPFYGAGSKGFAISDRWKLDGPPEPTAQNGAYRRAFDEVRFKGIANELAGTIPANKRRTVDEEIVGLFWGYDGAAGLGTPPRLFNLIVRKVAEAKNTTPAQNARLFALVNTAIADAGILAWDQKYQHDYWRPVVGIREHDASMGPAATIGRNSVESGTDIRWLPLGAPKTNEVGKNFSPPFPAYPSGHATFGAAALHVTRLFFGPNGIAAGGVPVGHRSSDQLFDGLTLVSEELDGVATDNTGTVRPRHVRSFPGGLWQMIEENGRSRVYLGVHWVFDAFAVNPANKIDLKQNVGGVPLGLRIAEDIFETGMQKSKVMPSI